MRAFKRAGIVSGAEFTLLATILRSPRCPRDFGLGDMPDVRLQHHAATVLACLRACDGAAVAATGAEPVGRFEVMLAEVAMQQLVSVSLEIALDSPVTQSPKTEFSAEVIYKALLSYAAAGVFITNSSEWLTTRLEATRCAPVFAYTTPPAPGGGVGAGGGGAVTGVKRPAAEPAAESSRPEHSKQAKMDAAAFTSWPKTTEITIFDNSRFAAGGRGCIYCGTTTCRRRDTCCTSPAGGQTKHYRLQRGKSYSISDIIKASMEGGGTSA